MVCGRLLDYWDVRLVSWAPRLLLYDVWAIPFISVLQIRFLREDPQRISSLGGVG